MGCRVLSHTNVHVWWEGNEKGRARTDTDTDTNTDTLAYTLLEGERVKLIDCCDLAPKALLLPEERRWAESAALHCKN